ncbi:MAG TPA: PKD domain-containing protein, partial [Cytophagaceae bacterium]
MTQLIHKYFKKTIAIQICILVSSGFLYSQTAAFKSDKVSGCSPLLIAFDGNISTGSDLLYSWDFGNGNSSTGKDKASVGAIYTAPGVYTVKLKVTNSQGTSTEIKTDYITVFRKPSPDFKISGDVKGCVPFNTSFQDLSTNGNAPINKWTWDFGDGEGANLKNPAHLYKTSGKYTVSLIAVDGNGCTNSVTKNDFVEIGDKVLANFSSQEGDSAIKFCKVPATINFIDKSKTPANATVEYLWNFGDGSSSNL